MTNFHLITFALSCAFLIVYFIDIWRYMKLDENGKIRVYDENGYQCCDKCGGSRNSVQNEYYDLLECEDCGRTEVIGAH